MKSISVVVTSFNQKRFLAEALKSIFNQTITPQEILVCDDYSTDGSRKMLKQYANKRDNLHLIFQNENVGVTKNRNTGLKEARNPFIALLDGDDWYSMNKLEVEYERLKESDCKWAYSLEKICGKSGNFLQTRLDQQTGKSGDIFKEIILREISPKHWMMEKEVLDDIGYLDEDMNLYEDWEFKIRLSHNYKACFCPESAIFYRQHGSGLHDASDEVYRQEKRKIYHKVLKEKRGQLNKIDDMEKQVQRFFL